MKTYEKAFLTLLSLLPLSSTSFSALETLSLEQPTLKERGSRLKDMFDAGFFTAKFYDKMASLGIHRGSDFALVQDEETRELIRQLVREESVELQMASTPSPT